MPADAPFKPLPMEGGGVYNRSSRVQAEGLLPAAELFEQAACVVPLPASPQPILFADYGSSQGHNSLLPMSLAIAALRKRIGPEQAISVVHTDLPDNDFTALFHTLSDDPESYLRVDPATFASAVGQSFYQQLLPAESVTLGWSSWAIQWLSQAPGTIPDQVQIAYSRDAAVREAFTQQAARDWRTFLSARSRELRHNARLVVLTMAYDQHGEFGYRPLLESIYAALSDMVQSSFITADELQRMVIPTVARSQADCEEPFVEGRAFEGLTLEQIEVFQARDRFWEQFQTSGDAQTFGKQWAAFSRASVFPTLAAALERGSERAAPFMARLEADVARRLAQSPEAMLIPLVRMVIAKTARCQG